MKKILLLAFTASVMLGACKKDKGGDEPETVPTCAMVKIREYNNSSTDIIRFDEQGRVKEETGNDWGTSYEYYSDKIVVTSGPSSGQNNRTITYTLGGQGRIIKSVENNDGASLGIITEYEYNSDGYLVEATRTGGGEPYTVTYTWTNGNLVKIESPWSTTDITYGNDVFKDRLIPGFIYGEIYTEYYIQDYFGKQPKNAPVIEREKSIQSSWSNNTVYSYTKDSKGQIISYTETKEEETDPWWEYTVDYNCN